MMAIGEMIKKLREEHSLTQGELASRVGVTRAAVSNWENGRNYPDIETLLHLSDELGASLDQLMREDYEMVQWLELSRKKKRRFQVALVLQCLLLICLAVFIGWQLTHQTEISYYQEQPRTAEQQMRPFSKAEIKSIEYQDDTLKVTFNAVEDASIGGYLLDGNGEEATLAIYKSRDGGHILQGSLLEMDTTRFGFIKKLRVNIR